MRIESLSLHSRYLYSAAFVFIALTLTAPLYVHAGVLDAEYTAPSKISNTTNTTDKTTAKTSNTSGTTNTSKTSNTSTAGDKAKNTSSSGDTTWSSIWSDSGSSDSSSGGDSDGDSGSSDTSSGRSINNTKITGGAPVSSGDSSPLNWATNYFNVSGKNIFGSWLGNTVSKALQGTLLSNPFGLFSPTPSAYNAPQLIGGTNLSPDLYSSQRFLSGTRPVQFIGGNILENPTAVKTQSYTGFFTTRPIGQTANNLSPAGVSANLKDSPTLERAQAFSMYAKEYGTLFAGPIKGTDVANIVTAQAAFENPDFDARCGGNSSSACGVGQYTPSTWDIQLKSTIKATTDLLYSDNPSEQQAAAAFRDRVAALDKAGIDMRSDPQVVAAVMSYHKATLYDDFVTVSKDTGVPIAAVAQMEHFGTGYYNALRDNPDSEKTVVNTERFLMSNNVICDKCTPREVALDVASRYAEPGRRNDDAIGIADTLLGTIDRFGRTGQSVPGNGTTQVAARTAVDTGSDGILMGFSDPVKTGLNQGVQAIQALLAGEVPPVSGNTPAAGSPEQIAQKFGFTLLNTVIQTIGTAVNGGDANAVVQNGVATAIGDMIGVVTGGTKSGTTLDDVVDRLLERTDPVTTSKAPTTQYAIVLKDFLDPYDRSSYMTIDVRNGATPEETKTNLRQAISDAVSSGAIPADVVSEISKTPKTTTELSVDDMLRGTSSLRGDHESVTYKVPLNYDNENRRYMELTVSPGANSEELRANLRQAIVDAVSSGAASAGVVETIVQTAAPVVAPTKGATQTSGSFDLFGAIGGFIKDPAGTVNGLISGAKPVAVTTGSTPTTGGVKANTSANDLLFSSTPISQANVPLTGGNKVSSNLFYSSDTKSAPIVLTGGNISLTPTTVKTQSVSGGSVTNSAWVGTAPGSSEVFNHEGLPATTILPTQEQVVNSPTYQQAVTDLLAGSKLEFDTLKPKDQAALIAILPEMMRIGAQEGLTDKEKGDQIQALLNSNKLLWQFAGIIPKKADGGLETDANNWGLGTTDEAVAKLNGLYETEVKRGTVTVPDNVPFTLMKVLNTTNSRLCTGLCSVVMTPFGGVEGARKMYDTVMAQQSPSAHGLFPVTGMTQIIDDPNKNDMFGDSRGSKRLHAGNDIYTPAGTPVIAVMDGVIRRADNDNPTGYGLRIDIEYPDGTVQRMAHLGEIKVQPGQVVKAGQVVALSGRSGIESAGIGDHVHYEVIRVDAYNSGQAKSVYDEKTLEEGRLDPATYFERRSADAVAAQPVSSGSIPYTALKAGYDLFNKTFPRPQPIVVANVGGVGGAGGTGGSGGIAGGVAPGQSNNTQSQNNGQSQGFSFGSDSGGDSDSTGNTGTTSTTTRRTSNPIGTFLGGLFGGLTGGNTRGSTAGNSSSDIGSGITGLVGNIFGTVLGGIGGSNGGGFGTLNPSAAGGLVQNFGNVFGGIVSKIFSGNGTSGASRNNNQTSDLPSVAPLVAQRPDVSCTPQSIKANTQSTITVSWACYDSVSADGVGFPLTNMAPAANAIINVGATSTSWLTYGVRCSNGTTRSCLVEVN